MVHAPSDDHVDRQTRFNTDGGAELAFFNLAAALQSAVINLDTPSFRIPVELFDRIIEGLDTTCRQ